MLRRESNNGRWVLDHALVALSCVCMSMAFTLYAEKHIYERLYFEALTRQLDFITVRKEVLRRDILPALKMPDGPQKTARLIKILEEAAEELHRQEKAIKPGIPAPANSSKPLFLDEPQ